MPVVYPYNIINHLVLEAIYHEIKNEQSLIEALKELDDLCCSRKSGLKLKLPANYNRWMPRRSEMLSSVYNTNFNSIWPFKTMTLMQWFTLLIFEFGKELKILTECSEGPEIIHQKMEELCQIYAGIHKLANKRGENYGPPTLLDFFRAIMQVMLKNNRFHDISIFDFIKVVDKAVENEISKDLMPPPPPRQPRFTLGVPEPSSVTSASMNDSEKEVKFSLVLS